MPPGPPLPKAIANKREGAKREARCTSTGTRKHIILTATVHCKNVKGRQAACSEIIVTHHRTVQDLMVLIKSSLHAAMPQLGPAMDPLRTAIKEPREDADTTRKRQESQPYLGVLSACGSPQVVEKPAFPRQQKPQTLPDGMDSEHEISAAREKISAQSDSSAMIPHLNYTQGT